MLIVMTISRITVIGIKIIIVIVTTIIIQKNKKKHNESGIRGRCDRS